MKELTEFTYRDYWNKTVFPSLIATAVAFIPMFGLRIIIDDNVYMVLSYAFISAVWASCVVLFVGMNKQERKSIIDFSKNKFKRNK